MDNNKVALLVFGGKSFEHDISIITALIIYNKAKTSSYKLLPVYISKNEEWFLFAGKEFKIDIFKNFESTYKSNGFKKIYLKTGDSSIFYKSGLIEKQIKVDCVLNCCHGGIGENGYLTAIFESHHIPVSSGSVAGMGICMDKVMSKHIFEGYKLPIIDYFELTKEEYEKNKAEVLEKVKELGLPVILKPSSLGSSIGIKVVKEMEDFDEAVNIAFEFDNLILVEKAILEGMREYNVACLRVEDKIKVSKIDQPKRSDEILSFKDKYIGDKTNTPSKTATTKIQPQKGKGGGYLQSTSFVTLPTKIEKQLLSISEQIYKELGLFGPVRIDFILNKKNKVFLNEINTVPGSLAYYFFVPSMFKTMGEYVDIVLNNAVKLFENKAKVKKEFITKLI